MICAAVIDWEVKTSAGLFHVHLCTCSRNTVCFNVNSRILCGAYMLKSKQYFFYNYVNKSIFTLTNFRLFTTGVKSVDQGRVNSTHLVYFVKEVKQSSAKPQLYFKICASQDHYDYNNYCYHYYYNQYYCYCWCTANNATTAATTTASIATTISTTTTTTTTTITTTSTAVCDDVPIMTY